MNINILNLKKNSLGLVYFAGFLVYKSAISSFCDDSSVNAFYVYELPSCVFSFFFRLAFFMIITYLT